MKILPALFLNLFALVLAAHPGIGIVEDSKGNIFYTDLKQVWKISPDGKKNVVVQNVHTHELFMDDQDNLFGEHLWYNGESVDTWGHYVWRLSSENRFQKIIPDTEGFLENYSFVQDHFGRMYWADRTKKECQQVSRKNIDNTITTLGDKCLRDIRWMTTTPAGAVYVVDFHDLKKIDQQGHVTTMAEKLPEKKLTQFFVNDRHALGGLCTDKDQNIYVSDYGGRKVKKIARDGKVTIVVETGIAWSPSGILVAANGDLCVLEYSITNEARVERIGRDGKRIVF